MPGAASISKTDPAAASPPAPSVVASPAPAPASLVVSAGVVGVSSSPSPQAARDEDLLAEAEELAAPTAGAPASPVG